MASIADLIVTLRTNLGPLDAGLGAARRGLLGFGRSAGGISSLTNLAFGGAGALGLGVAIGDTVKTAISMETAMAGLAKATDLDPAGMAAIKQELFGLSTTMAGVPLDNLVAIATEGGKLGIPASQVATYAAAVSKVSTAIDDMDAGELSNQIGKVNSVFKLDATQGALQLGSALDKVADSGVSSASDILNFTQRISGAAVAAKISAQEAIALGGALLDTGSHSEAASTAVTRLIYAFAAAPKPLQAMQAFLADLQKQDAATQLKSIQALGIDGVQAASEVQKLAQQSGTLTRYIGLANNEFITLDQITKSYAASSATTAAQQEVFSNKIQILKETIGAGLLPALNATVGGLGNLATGLTDTFTRFPGAVASLTEGSAALAVFGGDAGGIANEVGVAFRNMTDYLAITGLQIGDVFSNAWIEIQTMEENLYRLADYINTNWRALIVDAIANVGISFTNLGTNLSGLTDAIMQFGKTGEFNFEWTSLEEGFQRTAAELPEMLKPALISSQDAIDSLRAGITDRETARAGGAAKAPGGEWAKAPAAGGDFGADGEGGAWMPPEDKKERKTEITDLQGFASGLLTSAFGQQGVAEKALAAQEKQVTVMDEIRAVNSIMKDHLAALVRRGGGTVATGPA